MITFMVNYIKETGQIIYYGLSPRGKGYRDKLLANTSDPDEPLGTLLFEKQFEIDVVYDSVIDGKIVKDPIAVERERREANLKEREDSLLIGFDSKEIKFDNQTLIRLLFLKNIFSTGVTEFPFQYKEDKDLKWVLIDEETCNKTIEDMTKKLYDAYLANYEKDEG